MGQASAVFNEMMENFSGLVRQVRDAAVQVSAKVAALSKAPTGWPKVRTSRTKNRPRGLGRTAGR